MSSLGSRRRGIASVLAMLFLMLFVTLSLGFYATTTSSVQITSNSRSQTDAQYAAESGLQFISYHLRSIPPIQNTDPTAVYNYVTQQLDLRLAGTQNMIDASSGTRCNPNSYVNGTITTYYAPGYSLVNNKPVPHWMSIGSGVGQCFVMVQLVSTASPAKLLVTALGKSSGTSPTYRAVQYEIKATNNPTTVTNTTTSTQTVQTPWSAPNGSIVTYSAFSAHDGAVIKGSVTALPPTSQVPATVIGGAKISGTFSYPAGYPSPTVNNGGSIATTATVSTVPPIPSFDTSSFAPLVPPTSQTPLGSSWQSNQKFAGVVLNSSSQIGSSNTFNNIRIKANSNLTLYGNGSTINGVIYIESPNRVTFSGLTINGVIVSDNSSSAPYNPSTQNNVITINNGTTLNGTSSITSNINSAETTHMTQLKNMFTDNSGNPVNATMIFTPNYGLSFQGGMTVNGAAAIIGSQFTIANGSNVSLGGVMMGIGNSKFDVGGGMNIVSSTLPKAWPGTTTTTTQTVTNTTTSTVDSVTVSVNRTTYAEIDPWQFFQ